MCRDGLVMSVTGLGDGAVCRCIVYLQILKEADTPFGAPCGAEGEGM